MQPRRNAKAAKRFFRKLLKGHGYTPRVVVTDKVKRYGAAHRELRMSPVHETDRYRNNRAENSHQPTRQKERQMRGFKSACHAQRLISALGPTQDLFRHDRHLMSARSYRDLWARSGFPLEVVGLLFLAGHNLTELGALRRSLALYRLVFDHPRRHDLIGFLPRQVPEERLAEPVGRLRIDLVP